MGRRPNPQRRGELLSEILEYVEVNGLADLSLRPLANALGTSTYTLTYQFGSKDELLSSILDAVEEREAAADHNDPHRPLSERVDLLWDHTRSPHGWASQRLRVEAMLLRARLVPAVRPTDASAIDLDALIGDEQVAHGGDDEPLIGEPVGLDLRGDGPGAVDPAAHLIWSAAQGLVLEYLRTGDRASIEPGVAELRRRAHVLEQDQPDPAIRA